MKRIKWLSKKMLVFLLVLVMMATVLVSLNVGILKADANLSKTDDSCPITFLVPELIYLTPQTGSAANTFQYYIDSDSNGNLRTPTLAIQNNMTYGGDGYASIKYGNVYFNCPEATSVTISCSGAVPIFSVSSGMHTLNTTITSGTMSANVPEGQGTTITWTVAYVVNGNIRTATAYTYCYAPYCKPVAAAAKFLNTNWDNSWGQSLSWISGINGYQTSGFNGGAERGGDSSPNSSMLYPLTGNLVAPSNSHQSSSSWFTSLSGGSAYHISDEGTDDSIMFSNSPYGLLTVDTSRYKSFNQIPNLTIGFMVTDTQHSDKCSVYFSDFTGYSNRGNCRDKDNDHISEARDLTGSIIVGTTTASSSYCTEEIKYHNVWNRSIVEVAVGTTGYETDSVKGYLWAYNNDDDCANSCVCYLGVTKVNKSTLRAKIRQYMNLGLQSTDYTAATWSGYISALSDASMRLGNLTATNVSTDSLDNAYAALVKKTYTATITYMLPCTNGVSGLVNGTIVADAADGAMDGYISRTETLSFLSNDSVTFSPNSFMGYTISSAFGATTSTSTVTLLDQCSNINVSYLFDANTYTVTLNYGTDSVGGYGHQIYSSTYDISTIRVKYNHTYNNGFIPTPTMTGWCFLGWHTSSSYATKVLGTDVMMQTNAHTIYARWSPYFSGGHGLKKGDTINGMMLSYDDMFLISNVADFNRIGLYDSNFRYTTSSGVSFKQTSSFTLY